ncbi:hypothetical protein GEMRC1_010193 [Eukaryota sp. GEM-RC1]
MRVLVLLVIAVLLVVLVKADRECEEFVKQIELDVGGLLYHSPAHVIDIIDLRCSQNNLNSLCLPENAHLRFQIYDLIKTDASPKQICVHLHLSEPHSVENNFVSCKICQFVVNWIEKRLDLERDVLHESLHQMCHSIPNILYKETCLLMEKMYLDSIIDFLVNDVDPKEVCEWISICDSNVMATTNDADDDDERFSPVCWICSFLMSAIEDKINDKSTRSDIEKFLKEGCAAVPAMFQDLCERTIQETIDEMITLLIAKFPPDLLCQTLRLCQRDELLASSSFCGTCKNVLSYVHNLDEYQVHSMLKVAKMYCATKHSLVCVKTLDTIESFLDDIIKGTISPEEICQRIALC